MRHAASLAALFCTLFAWTSAYPAQEKGEEGKISMVARASPALREYFRDMYSRVFTDSLNDGMLNRVLDSQIDEFVKRLLQKNESLAAAARSLSERGDPASQSQHIRRIRDIAGDLEGMLRIWSDSLRPQSRTRNGGSGEEAPTLEALAAEIALYQRQINQFLFPDEVAVSVEELRSGGFRGTLKRIRHIAGLLERDN
ncbi:MAG: hypothetical protein HYX74_12335 [Acidobacteria bacterium]|nr:hypothetical protein [Acidobacteriota bacterium]